MIKAVFFDFDGVLALDADGFELITRNLCGLVPGLSYESTLENYRRLGIPLLNNGVPHETILPELRRDLGKDISPEAIKSALRNVHPNIEMLEVARALRSQCRVGIISDNFADRIALVDHDFHLSETFDPIVLSANVHASKFENTPAIYEYALSQVGCKAAEVAFIDNAQRNLPTPASMGISTFWHGDTKNDVEAVRNFLRIKGINLHSGA